MRSILAVLLIAFSASSFALEGFNHEYKSTFAGFSAKTTRSLTEVEEGVWELKMTARNLFAKYEETSRFRLDAEGYPVPVEHIMESRVFGAKRNEYTEFNWQEGVATWTRKKDLRTAELRSGMVDRILYQILIPQDLASGMESLSYEFINRGDEKIYDFENLGTETITLGDREIETVKVRRIDDKKEKETTVWIAPEMGYEIIKLHHLDDDGADYKMELKL